MDHKLIEENEEIITRIMQAMGIPVLWIINNIKTTPPWGRVVRVLPHNTRKNSLEKGFDY